MIVITTSNSISVNPHRVPRRVPLLACPAVSALRHPLHCWTSQQWHTPRPCLDWANLEAFMATLPLFSAAPRRPLNQPRLDQA